MAEQTINNNNLSRDGNPTNSVDLIFPLQTEITFEIKKLPQYIEKLNHLFDFYEKQLKTTNKQFKNYNLRNELFGLTGFFANLDLAIKDTNRTRPVIAHDPEKLSVLDYEYITLKVIANLSDAIRQGFQNTDSASVFPLSTEFRDFSDGTTREVILYNQIHSVYLTNKTFARSLAVFSPIQTSNYGISTSTLSLLFNIKQIVDNQVNSPISTDLLLCAGNKTNLSRLEQGFSILGFDVPLLTSKVNIKDFLNAYIHPIQEIITAPRLINQTACNQQVKDRISLLRSKIIFYNISSGVASLAGVPEESPEYLDYLGNKKELAQLTKLCPELNSEIAPFEKIKELDKIGKLFSQFLEKYNIACIVDEALKCVMPQIPCDDILRDLTVDNFETRLQTAFPHQKQIIAAISKKVKENLDEEKATRAREGRSELTIDEQSRLVLDTINKFIDLEALCKIDIPAIIALIQGLFNFKLPQFNMFDWQFNFKIDFQTALLEGLFRSIFDMISRILNELIGCDAFDNLIAGIIDNSVEANNGLYGDLAAIFGGDFDFNNSNTKNILGENLDNFLNQNSKNLAKIIKFETKLGNNFLGQTNIVGELGAGTSLDNLISGTVTTKTDTFGGLVSLTTQSTGSIGLAGFKAETDKIAQFDVTKLATTQGQADLLKEIGKFQASNIDGNVEITRISDDSIVEIYKQPAPVIEATSPTTTTQAITQQQNIFTKYNIRDKNQQILNALAILNEREQKASIYITQQSLADQIKDYIKTCFALLSPSETIELITGDCSNEVKLTITGISQVRYPLLHAIFIYPDRHASMFASFGNITGLDSVVPRLQILASNPSVKQKMVDPNVCAPFTNIYDFRRGLMNQALPADLANQLMDNLIEDDRQRANKLLESLAKGLKQSDGLTTGSLKPNKSFDGKPIQEIDEAIDGVLGSILDQVKIAFDEDIDSFAAATATSKELQEVILEYSPQIPTTLFGFNTPTSPDNRIVNKEFSEIFSGSGEQPRRLPGDQRYYNRTTNKNITGKLLKDIFNNYRADIKTGFLQGNLLTDTRNIDTIYQITATSSLQESDELSRFKSTTSASASPSWLLDYKETDNGKYKFVIRTGGDVKITTPPAINFSEKIIFSGSTIQLDTDLQNLITQLGLTNNISEPCDTISPPTRFQVFESIFAPRLKEVFNFDSFSIIKTLQTLNKESKSILDYLAELSFSEQDFTNSKLLKTVQLSEMYPSDNSTTIQLNLIDFSPLQTEEHKNCGIDTHLLQLEAVKKRIKDSFNSTQPENLVNTNSRINTRYNDGKPGLLSANIMTGLVDTFIRTSVIHNIFKGLFIFDKFNYNINAFSYEYLIYLFIENRAKKDIKYYDLETDFESEYSKIYDWYVKESLINTNNNESKFYKIVKYHVDSVLKFLNDLINGKNFEFNPNSLIENECLLQQTTNPVLQNLAPIAINEYKTKNLKFINNIIQRSGIKNTYSNFYDYEAIAYQTSEQRGQLPEGQEGYSPQQPVSQTGYFAIPNALEPFRSNITFDSTEKYELILEKYTRLQFKDAPPAHLTGQSRQIFENFKNNTFLNNVVNISNFRQMYEYLQLLSNSISNNINIYNNQQDVILYSKDPSKRHLDWLKEQPKLGLRLSIKKCTLVDYNNVENEGFSETYFFEDNSYPTAMPINSTTQQILQNNKKEKAGPLQSITLDDFQTSQITDQEQRQRLANAKIAKINSIASVIPLITKELDISKDPSALNSPTNLKNLFSKITSETNLPNNFYFRNLLIQEMIDDPKFTLLVNYCLQNNIGNTFALFNSFVGMNNEAIYKLLDTTKKTIKDNFNIHKNSGTFKNKANNNAYQKLKTKKTDGPLPIEYLKAATTIPIGILKGLATAVDPNIFLADKIVLAGKMGFIQPKYKRFKTGEEIKQIGTNEIYITSEGIAADGTYILDDGEYKAKKQSDITEGGNPLIDFTPVALTETRDDKIVLQKDQNGKNIIKYGPIPNQVPEIPYTGIPWSVDTDSAADPNFDENDITIFDQKPSLPIFPGEKINIPYKVASLALAPFPIFTPGATTYNLAMPFGPLFLTLEDLLAENPQFKFSGAKKKDSPVSTGDNLLCDDNSND